MLSFINNQTIWYKEKQKAFEKLRVEMLKETASGRYKLAIRQKEALNKFEAIFKIATIVSEMFSPGFSKTKEMILAEQTMESMNKLIDLDINFKRKQVYPSGCIKEARKNQLTKNEFIFNNKNK